MFLLVASGVAPFAHGCSQRGQTGNSGEAPGDGEPAQQARVEIDVFALGRQLGAVAPCGCTTEPLGGLQYGFGYIEASSSSDARVVIEPGSFLYPDPNGPEAPTDAAAWAQADQRAWVLQRRFSKLGDGLVSGLGPTDLVSAHGTAALGKWPMPRVLGNLTPAGRKATGEVSTHKLVSVGEDLRVGVTVVVDPALAAGVAGFPETADPVEAAKEVSSTMRNEGADLVVVSVHGPRALAERVALEVPGLDLVVMSGVLEGAERSRTGSVVQKKGDGYLVEPGDQVQTVTHLTLSVETAALETGLPAATAWTVVPPRSQRQAELSRLEARVKKFKADPSADAAFVARLEQERDQLARSLETDALPDAPAVAIFEQVKITCHLSADTEAKKALGDYDGWVAAENQKRFAGVKAPALSKGQAGYEGLEECETCHDEAATYWNETVHARAYDTLVQANKQFDLSCVGCHVTGFRKPGGSEVVENEGLTSVQCEQCHGPGSKHIDDPEKYRLKAATPVDTCLECHTPEHSDTFEHTAYLRDILGEGHGVDARKKLGDGPTGKELRAAGLKKAGGACKKM